MKPLFPQNQNQYYGHWTIHLKFLTHQKSEKDVSEKGGWWFFKEAYKPLNLSMYICQVIYDKSLPFRTVFINELDKYGDIDSKFRFSIVL